MTHFEVKGSDGRPVRAVSHGDESAPAVLVAHGFKGFKDWGMFPWLAEQIAEAGLRAIRFDFSHNGVEETDFDRLDLFMLDTPHPDYIIGALIGLYVIKEAIEILRDARSEEGASTGSK